MLVSKRESPPPHCTPISSSIRICWVDLLVIFLILLVIAYVLLGVPLTAHLGKMLRGKRRSSNPPLFSSGSSSSRNTTSQRSHTMSSRRQDSEETLLEEPVNVGNHKVDDAPHDPFLIVQPSLNDSLLVKQGLVEETMLPPLTHIAHDVQCRMSQVSRSGSTPDSSSRTRSESSTGTNVILQPTRSQSGTISRGTIGFSTKESRMTQDKSSGDSDEIESEVGDVPPPPPPAYTPFPVGQGRGRSGSYDGYVIEIMRS
ncbi:hypothetical protein B0F90DRAFT_1704064 [Multifurca ochricompacta]|uniref:Uncharacterized protein n=1 Tax=Multifurca ochricompacta TaxID=376703 RepID=A0AAD4M6N9_9AGAM|nr:hypothetical protein B0F90DRAFT_1704064 [Multifurca ochricompacta]